MFSHLQRIHRCLRQKLTVDSYPFHHCLPDFFLCNLPHSHRHKVQITLVCYVEFDLVPDIREQRPGVIVDGRAEYFRIGKPDYSAGGMVSREILTAKFPQRRIKVADVNNVARRASYFYAVANSIWGSDHEVDPSYEACDRLLERKPQHQRDQAQGYHCRVPVDE